MATAAGVLLASRGPDDETKPQPEASSSRSQQQQQRFALCRDQSGEQWAPYNHPHHTSTHQEKEDTGLAVVDAELTVAPHVPPPIARREPVLLRVKMDSQVTEAQLEPPQTYDFWTFSGTVPGPFIRARVGDTMEVRYPCFLVACVACVVCVCVCAV